MVRRNIKLHHSKMSSISHLIVKYILDNKMRYFGVCDKIVWYTPIVVNEVYFQFTFCPRYILNFVYEKVEIYFYFTRWAIYFMFCMWSISSKTILLQNRWDYQRMQRRILFSYNVFFCSLSTLLILLFFLLLFLFFLYIANIVIPLSTNICLIFDRFEF